jgi:hypothetical protein
VILTEFGLHFTREGDHWRCVEHPALVMLPGDRYEVEGREFDTLAEAAQTLRPAHRPIP